MKNNSFLKLISFVFFLASCKNNNPYISDRSLDTLKILAPIFLNGLQLDSIINTNFKDPTSGQSLGNPQLLDISQSGEEYYLIKRAISGYVEVHESWDDVVIIRSGHGLLRTGKLVEGETQRTDEKPFRSWHGGKIVNANERKIEPGDFVIIPAMTAHQYIPDNHDTLTYWTIKIKRHYK